MTFFDDEVTIDTCASCDGPVSAPHTCYCCLLPVCDGCAHTDAAGDVLCSECAKDMGAFLADGEVPRVAQMPRDGQVELPGIA